MRKKNEPSKSISIKDVARECGVSISTVSRVINNFSTVKNKNRLKVLEAEYGDRSRAVRAAPHVISYFPFAVYCNDHAG